MKFSPRRQESESGARNIGDRWPSAPRASITLPMKKFLSSFLCFAAAWAISTVAASAAVTATKSAALLTDANNNTKPDPGDALEYTITIQNSGPGSATGVSLSDALDPNTTLLN